MSVFLRYLSIVISGLPDDFSTLGSGIECWAKRVHWIPSPSGLTESRCSRKKHRAEEHFGKMELRYKTNKKIN